MNVTLDNQQRELLVTLIDASRRGARQRPAFSYRRTPPDEQPRLSHPGLRVDLVASLGDLEVLETSGLLAHRSRIAGTGEIELTAAAYAAYDRLVTDRMSGPTLPPTAILAHSSTYVDPSRIAELESIKNEDYDLTRLIRLCEELNVVWPEGAYHATSMLVRAILDHVPPIFGVARFAEVTSNYPASQSFKEAMAHLSTAARKIADAHLHMHVRRKEILPSGTQVNFAPALDMLLAEIARILRK